MDQGNLYQKLNPVFESTYVPTLAIFVAVK